MTNTTMDFNNTHYILHMGFDRAEEQLLGVETAGVSWPFRLPRCHVLRRPKLGFSSFVSPLYSGQTLEDEGGLGMLFEGILLTYGKHNPICMPHINNIYTIFALRILYTSMEATSQEGYW